MSLRIKELGFWDSIAPREKERSEGKGRKKVEKDKNNKRLTHSEGITPQSYYLKAIVYMGGGLSLHSTLRLQHCFFGRDKN